MTTDYWTYRPSKRPKVAQVSRWDKLYENWNTTWKGQEVWARVENGYPFPDFYRVTYAVDGTRKSKLFYGETAWNDTERFVYDLGLFDVLGKI